MTGERVTTARPQLSQALPRSHGPPRAGRRAGGGRSSDSRARRLPASPTGRRFPGRPGAGRSSAWWRRSFPL